MSMNLYVGNLSFQTTEDALRTLFSEYGDVARANLITDRYSGRSRGFAFVEMATEEAGLAAIDALNGRMVDERQIRVERAKPRPSRDRHGGRRRDSNW
jgi:RNA recognition motif-containing protein